MDGYFGEFRIANLLFQRSLAAVYCVAFLAAFNQFPALLGEHGLLPVPAFVKAVPFSDSPSIFQFFYSDRFFTAAVGTGLLLSTLLVFGVLEKGPWWLLASVWATLYFLYLSIVNVGQVFYAFGWESMLVEAGFFAAFLGPVTSKPSLIPVMALRWMLFRLILGAGLIKLRNDPCWRDLTCLNSHFETQPMPNPLSWFAHQLPKPVLAGGVVMNHVVEVVAPFGLLGPTPVAAVAGILIIGHQMLLIATGNFSFLNYLTIVLCLLAFSDALLHRILPLQLPVAQPMSSVHQGLLYLLASVTVLLSLQPALNLLSRQQDMNRNYNAWQLVNTYGMFGTITKERYEVVIEGTADNAITTATRWREYAFKGKPGDITKRPPQVAPYHLRLDWLLWFVPFSVEVSEAGLATSGYELWFVRLMQRLLEGDPKTLALFASTPFGDKPPRYVRAAFYRYQFTTPAERQASHAWWKRKWMGEYMPPIDLGALHAAGLD